MSSRPDGQADPATPTPHPTPSPSFSVRLPMKGPVTSWPSSTAGGAPSGAGDDWVEAEVERMAEAWQRGERPTASEVLARHPEIDDEAAVRLIFEEACLRRDAGLSASTTEVVRQYPRWRAALEPLLSADRLMRPPGSAARFRSLTPSTTRSGSCSARSGSAAEAVFPQVGERLGDFRLLAELGRGAAGRTFLAAQPSLADRPVVLKVTARDHVEHLSLARLQHTHIVPLYSEQVFPDRGLRGLCMPYLGGATLARILDGLAAIPVDQRRGRDLLQALDRLGDGADDVKPPADAPASPAAGPYRQFLDQASYVQAVCWVAACLADALQYAHDRGLVHMDVKPSNVLIAADGQPMLLDFHLAVSPLRPGDGSGAGAIDRLGGTRGWMSPEQRSAMAAVVRGRDVAVAVDGRSDLYALGLLLYEALGGPGHDGKGNGNDNGDEQGQAGPDRSKRPQVRVLPRLDRRNPKVSTGLADVVQRCLEPDPADRYPGASALADDLRRHLNDLPLRGVPNRSVVERWQKWRRRRPDALTRGSARLTAVLALVAAAALGSGFYVQRLRAIEGARDDSQRLRTARRFEEARLTAVRGLDLTRRMPYVGALRRDLEVENRRAIRGQKIDGLHALADRIRFHFGVASTVSDEMRGLAPKVRKFWEGRDQFAPDPDGLDVLDIESERRYTTDLPELAVVWADLRVRLAPAERLNEALREALAVLDQAEEAFGTSPALRRDRLAHARELGVSDREGGSSPPPPRSAWEHYQLGRSYLRTGQFAEASVELDRTLELRPQDFWPNFYQGMCAYRLHRYDEALAAFRACVTLDPDKAPCWINRAMTYERLGRNAEALRDYDRAVERDPRLAEAYLDRAILKYRTGRPADAVDDLQRALSCPIDREREGQVHFNLALAYRALGDRATADAEARRAVELGSLDARALVAPARPGR
jgi:serine/threonine protein kinase/tetratricopeptide (TPR) repeat protein